MEFVIPDEYLHGRTILLSWHEKLKKTTSIFIVTVILLCHLPGNDGYKILGMWSGELFAYDGSWFYYDRKM